jgi:hypothetical protein
MLQPLRFYPKMPHISHFCSIGVQTRIGVTEGQSFYHEFESREVATKRVEIPHLCQELFLLGVQYTGKRDKTPAPVLND